MIIDNNGINKVITIKDQYLFIFNDGKYTRTSYIRDKGYYICLRDFHMQIQGRTHSTTKYVLGKRKFSGKLSEYDLLQITPTTHYIKALKKLNIMHNSMGRQKVIYVPVEALQKCYPTYSKLNNICSHFGVNQKSENIEYYINRIRHLEELLKDKEIALIQTRCAANHKPSFVLN